ncbi:MAG: TonB-dependent receptor plug domain-containing protein [Sphingobacteriaceae bacterium]|nr:TonB-dependent receptor plug domain-containing protein [Sphingobacteriaceae bacterium]
MKLLLLALFSILFTPALAQNPIAVFVKDSVSGKGLAGATVEIKALNKRFSADANGLANIGELPIGKYLLEIRFAGYQTHNDSIAIPLVNANSLTYLLVQEAEDLEEVVITSTRSSRSIANIPTRVETIIGEELDEKSVMQPGNIRMLLTESTGIQTQQTSQVSGNASIRIQGLDGKYTQLLQDGFPLYSGFSSGLSILQIPPLNLKRVEVIKGSSSTLYGGGAIAGLVNLITKEPSDEREISFLVNGNQTGAVDLSSFYSQRFNKTGLTVYTAGNSQKAFDNNKDALSDIPKFNRITFNPKFFYYPNPKTTLSIGLISGFENRIGGNLKRIEDDLTGGFFERNRSSRYSTQTKFEKRLEGDKIFTAKNSLGYFNRNLSRSNYIFEGRQLATFTELNYLIPLEKSEWNLGANYVSDDFKQLNETSAKLNYQNSVFGLFAQNSYSFTDKIIVEAGMRMDVTNRNDVFILPRLSSLFKFNSDLSVRIGGGLGYKTPGVFSEETEERAFQDIDPIDFEQVKPERSYGLNGDINYRITFWDKLIVSANQLFFYTRLQDPIVLRPNLNSTRFSLNNASGYLSSKGFETNIRLRYSDFSGYFGYTFIDAERNFNGTGSVNPLTAKSRVNANIMYEIEDKLRIAYEAFYTGRQYLSSGERVRDFWVMGFSAERKFEKFSIFFNLENFLDTRQTRWQPSYSGSLSEPDFFEIYTPTDGFIFNGGFKLKL